MPSTALRRVTCAAAAVCLLTSSAAYAQRVDGSFQRTLTVGQHPDVEIVSGSGGIDVRQGSSGRIEITGRIRASDWGWSRSPLSSEERVRRLEANPPIEQQGDVIRIGHISDDALRNGVSVSYEVVLPAGSSVRAKSGSGSQRIEGVEGNVESSAGSGSIVIRRSGGRVRASTGSGSVTADAIGGNFEVSTGSGAVDATAVKGAIAARTSSGHIDVTQTGSGDVEASSSSGRVRLRGIRGGLRASTSSGGLDVEGQMDREWRLSSSSGHVSIDMPASQGFELDANSNSGGISVGFPISVSGTIGRHALRGSARGGGPLLYVRTSSGGISVR